jgi:hypothetical protein
MPMTVKDMNGGGSTSPPFCLAAQARRANDAMA